MCEAHPQGLRLGSHQSAHMERPQSQFRFDPTITELRHRPTNSILCPRLFAFHFSAKGYHGCTLLTAHHRAAMFFVLRAALAAQNAVLAILHPSFVLVIRTTILPLLPFVAQMFAGRT